MKHDWSYTVYGNVQETIPAAAPNLLANQLLLQPHLMLIFSTDFPLVHSSLHAFISVTKPRITGILRSKQQWKQLRMALSLLTEVWHMAHFWVSYGRCTMPGSPMGRSEGSSRRWTG